MDWLQLHLSAPAEQVPAVGAMLEHPSGWRLEVTGGDERHVTRLRLHPPVTDEEEGA